MPDKTKIFLTCLWVWTYMMHYTTRFANFVIFCTFQYMPDSLILNRTSNEKTIIINSRIHKKNTLPEDITNKMQFLIKLIWDPDIDNENGDVVGGINVSDVIKLYPKVVDSVLWVAYSNAPESLVKYMLVDFNNKILFRKCDLSDCLKIRCGEVPM